jgi:type VI secretion system protein ImpC
MPGPLSFTRASVELTAGLPEPERTSRPDSPFQIVVLGDFTARSSPGPADRLKDRAPILVDRDNLDEVLARLVRLDLPLGSRDDKPLTIQPRELDDLHPDRLFQTLEVFQSLRQLRSELGNPATFEKAAARLGIERSTTKTTPPPTSRPEPPPADSADLLERILGGGDQSRPAAAAPEKQEWDAWLGRIVQPYVLPRIDRAEQAQLQAAVDDAISAQMRALLHHGTFQAIESAWRSLSFLVRRLDTGSHLRLYLLDVCRADLAADLQSSDDLRNTGTYRLLVEWAANAQPWSLVVGLYSFDAGEQDVDLLSRLALIASRAGAPFLAEASSRVLGCASLAGTPDPLDWQSPGAQEERNWNTLRQLPQASYLGLALPRFLLRLPYGKDAASVEQFRFEEMPQGMAREGYLWGSPAVAAAYLLAEAFSRRGWDLRPGDVLEIDGLPVHVYREEGESRAQPCTEALLGMRAVEAIRDRGLMALLSSPGRDVVRLAGFQSLAAGAAPLAGPWAR